MPAVDDTHPRPEHPRTDTDIPCRRGDYILIPAEHAGDWRDPQPDESLAGDLTHVSDRHVWMMDGDVIFKLPLRYHDIFLFQRAQFLIGGSAAMETAQEAPMALSEARLTPHAPVSADAAPVDRDTEIFLTGIARGLLGLARQQITEFNTSKLALLAPAIHKRAQEKLAEARQEILAEAKVYLGANAGSADVSLRLKRPDVGKPPDMSRLREELAQIQTLKAQVDALSRERSIEIATILSAMGGTHAPLPNPGLPDYVEQRTAPVNDKIRPVQSALNEAIIRASLVFPVIWKIWSHSRPDEMDTSELQAMIVSMLQDTFAANSEIDARIKRKPASVWSYSVIVEEVLNLHQVPQLCCARIAAMERCGLADESRKLISNMTIASGLASLGVVIAGSAVAPPIAAAVIVADAALSVGDAIAEYEEYSRRSAAFRACLDPRKALVAEPSLASAAFVIGLDILSVFSAKVPK